MSKLDGYKPFVVIKNAVNKLESQGLINLVGEKNQIVEIVTQELIQAGVLREYINAGRPYPTNIHSTLEEFITEGGRVIFIRNMNFEANQGLFTLDLQFDPNFDHIDKTLIFRDVQDFEETLDEEGWADDDIDSIIGLDQYSTRYVLKTEVREIVFSSATTPEILLVERKQ
jgi:hypothetical protein